MEDKMFDLMSKIYSELQDTRQEVKSIGKKVTGIESRVSSIENTLVRFENDVNKKLDALFDGYKQVYESNEENSKKLDDIQEKVSQQEVQIKVIQGGK